MSSCARCAAELEELEPGNREGHRCTHQQDGADTDTEAEQRDGATIEASSRRQPNAGVIRQYLMEVREKFELITKALSTLASVCVYPEEAHAFEQHLLVFAEYIADLRARAEDVLQVLDAAVRPAPLVQVDPGAGVSNTGTVNTQGNVKPENTGNLTGVGDNTDNTNNNIDVVGAGQQVLGHGVEF